MAPTDEHHPDSKQPASASPSTATPPPASLSTGKLIASVSAIAVVLLGIGLSLGPVLELAGATVFAAVAWAWLAQLVSILLLHRLASKNAQALALGQLAGAGLRFAVVLVGAVWMVRRRGHDPAGLLIVLAAAYLPMLLVEAGWVGRVVGEARFGRLAGRSARAPEVDPC